MKKILRANHISCTAGQSLKPDTLKTKLRKVFQKQRNFYSKLYKKELKKYYNSIDTTYKTDNKLFWKLVEILLTDEGTSKSKNTMVEMIN